MYPTQIKTTCPRDCYDACGIIADRSNGQLRILGDPDHAVARGKLCQKCAVVYNGAWIDPEQRLQRPLKRVGRKGEARFEPVSWDQAIREIADRLRSIVDADEAAKILQTHYTGTVALLSGWFPLRLFNHLGATEVDPDTVCNKAGHVALDFITGSSLTGFDPRSLRDAKTIVVWGANPSAAAPHMHKHWLGEATATKIVIDPIRHDTAKTADLFLQPRPGTDAALAFGFMYVAKRDGLIDQPFIDQCVLGWDEIQDAVNRATPAWTEQKTGVPAALIEQAARIYGEGPSMLWLGQGLQRQPRGGNVFRAIASLVAATGNICKPGTGMCYMNGPASRNLDVDAVSRPDLGQPGSISHMDLADHLMDPAASRALICWNNNILASSPQQAKLREALQREDLLHVCLELFATDTTDYADYVLPAASFMEFDDLVASYWDLTLSAQVKVKDPEGESLSNQEIFRRLAAAMQLDEPALHESDASMLATLMEQSGTGLTFEQLKGLGTVGISDEPIVQFADRKFPTPSGRIEIASASAEAAGHPRVPQPHADERTHGGRLRVLSPASPHRMNSSYANDARILRKTRGPEVLLHPEEAADRGLAESEAIELYNDQGVLPLTVVCDESVPMGVALVYKGRWPKLDPGRANVNVLNPGRKTDIAESSCVHSIEAEIRRIASRPVSDMPVAAMA